jgi:hypothetical protein
MNQLSGIITTLVLLKGSSRLSIDERAAVGCAVQIMSEVERLSISLDVCSKDFFYSTHPENKKPLDIR